MRARYYNVDYRRFVNADVIAGNISNAVTLNRYAYANGNPVSLVDPFGLSADTRYAYASANMVSPIEPLELSAERCAQNTGTQFDSDLLSNKSLQNTYFSEDIGAVYYVNYDFLKHAGHSSLFYKYEDEWYMIQFRSGDGMDLALEIFVAFATASSFSTSIYEPSYHPFDTYAYVQWEKIGNEDDVMERINKADKTRAVFLPGDYSSIHDTKYVPDTGDFNIDVEKYNLFNDNCNTFVIDLIRESGNEEVIDRIGYNIIPNKTYKKLSKHYDYIDSK